MYIIRSEYRHTRTGQKTPKVDESAARDVLEGDRIRLLRRRETSTRTGHSITTNEFPLSNFDDDDDDGGGESALPQMHVTRLTVFS